MLEGASGHYSFKKINSQLLATSSTTRSRPRIHCLQLVFIQAISGFLAVCNAQRIALLSIFLFFQKNQCSTFFFNLKPRKSKLNTFLFGQNQWIQVMTSKKQSYALILLFCIIQRSILVYFFTFSRKLLRFSIYTLQESLFLERRLHAGDILRNLL